MSGLVQWFDAAEAIGFVTAEDGQGDILLHLSELRAFGVPSVAEGARVLVRVETTAPGGWRWRCSTSSRRSRSSALPTPGRSSRRG